MINLILSKTIHEKTNDKIEDTEFLRNNRELINFFTAKKRIDLDKTLIFENIAKLQAAEIMEKGISASKVTGIRISQNKIMKRVAKFKTTTSGKIYVEKCDIESV